MTRACPVVPGSTTGGNAPEEEISRPGKRTEDAGPGQAADRGN